jgi:MoaA/NifB/PqqE/SkfB family radical SAM enzyme
LSCWHCAKSTQSHKGHSASKEIIDYVNNKILPHAKYLRIGGIGIGEPLCSKNFTYFFSNFKKKNLKETHLVTNLTLLDDEKADIIVRNIDNLEISIEGTKDNYSKIRHFSWNTILDNIKMLQILRNKNSKSKLKITLLVCAMLSNIESLIDLFELRSLGIDRIVFREFIPCEKEKEIECLWQNPHKTYEYIKIFNDIAKETKVPIEINFAEKYDLSAGKSKKTKKIWKLKKCYFPWTCISIDCLGNISSCCFPMELAKLHTCEEELLGIWNNENFVVLRKTVNSIQPLSPCLQCEFRVAHLDEEEKPKFVNKHQNPNMFKKIAYCLRPI